MMGFYRFWLALGVVLFHFGSANWIIGRVAVFCFFMVSGFVISRVIHARYQARIGAFYLNRVLRLLPLYLVLAGVTVVIANLHGVTFQQEGGRVHRVFSDMLVDSPLSWGNYSLIPQLSVREMIPVYAAGPHVMAQAWSISVDLVFYAAAPLIVLGLVFQAKAIVFLTVVWTIFFMSVCFWLGDYNTVEEVVYKNAVTSGFMFLWGVLTYWATVIWPRFQIHPALTLALVLGSSVFIYTIAATNEIFGYQPTTYGFVSSILLCIPGTAAVCLMGPLPDRIERISESLGNLSYGIYLNHFICAALLLWAAELYGSDIFGTTLKTEFGLWCAALSIALAAVTYRLIEAPIEGLRRRVGGRSVRPEQLAPAVSTEQPGVQVILRGR